MDAEDPYSDPDHFQNSIISSFYLFRHILKISSKSVHKFLIYLVHKHIWQPGSRWSRSLPKSNHLFLVPFRTFPENFIKIHPWLFELFVFKLYFMDPEDPDSGPDHSQNWIISSFYHFFLLPFLTYPKNIIKIHPKIPLQPGSRWSRSLQKCNHLFLVSFWVICWKCHHNPSITFWGICL